MAKRSSRILKGYVSTLATEAIGSSVISGGKIFDIREVDEFTKLYPKWTGRFATGKFALFLADMESCRQDPYLRSFFTAEFFPALLADITAFKRAKGAP